MARGATHNCFKHTKEESQLLVNFLLRQSEWSPLAFSLKILLLITLELCLLMKTFLSKIIQKLPQVLEENWYNSFQDTGGSG